MDHGGGEFRIAQHVGHVVRVIPMAHARIAVVLDVRQEGRGMLPETIRDRKPEPQKPARLRSLRRWH